MKKLQKKSNGKSKPNGSPKTIPCHVRVSPETLSVFRSEAKADDRSVCYKMSWVLLNYATARVMGVDMMHAGQGTAQGGVK
jgi:hypothetical protein